MAAGANRLTALRQLFAESGRSISDLVREGVETVLSTRHGFNRAERFERALRAAGEIRYVITGMVNDVILTVVYTERGERPRIISARRATKHEQEEYYRSQTAE